MDAQTIIARRVAQELRPGNLVNLGIGIPTLVANYVPEGLNVFFQSENGLIGTGPIPEQGLAHPLLTDAGGRPISALPGRRHLRQRDVVRPDPRRPCRHHRARRFAGRCRWTPRQLDDPRQDGAGMGGAMDLVSGAKRVIVAMQHAAKGKSKIVAKCNLPLTSARPIDLVVTDMAVIAFPGGKATLQETAPGITVAEVLAVTEAELTVPDSVLEMKL
jgi:acetate CoA/acetoacetate CoA-transferase beta subunit